MPIIIPEDLPARPILDAEGIRIITEPEAIRQDVRPLRIAILNLMPEKIKTETQITRLIGATPLQVDVTLITTSSYTPKNVSAQHLLDFYKPWADIAHEKFDGLIITGAPVETLPFEEVQYWDELKAIMDWSLSNVHETHNICWGGQAALWHFHRVPKYELLQKRFGIFQHHVVTPNTNFLRGFNDIFPVTVSRHTENHLADLEGNDELVVLAASDEAGLCAVRDEKRRQLYSFNHFEYETDTLGIEFARDRAAGMDIDLPKNYFPDDDPTKKPVNYWRVVGHLFFANWINHIYQTTPFDIDRISAEW